MLKNLDPVVLIVDLPAFGLRKDDIGTIVDDHRDASFEVEFIAFDGTLIALETFDETQIRSLGSDELSLPRRVAA